MNTMSLAPHEGGRQLRRRKDAQISLSTQAVISMDTTPTRKTSNKGAVAASPTDDDVEPVYNKGESLTSDLEARLWNLDKSDQLTKLTVLELRGFMKHISKPTAGRKEELISEVKKWLAERQALSTHQIQLEASRAAKESSSDAESLEGALLKAENKSRQSEALSRLKRNSVDGIGSVAEKQVAEKASTILPGISNNSLPNEDAVQAPNLPARAAKRKTIETIRSSQGGNNTEKDGESLPEEEVRHRATGKGNKVNKGTKESMEKEVSVKTAVTPHKRKVQVSETLQSKKGADTDGEAKPWTILAHKKPQPGWVAYDPDAMRPGPPSTGAKSMKLVSWNVNGLRALMKDKDNDKIQDTVWFTKLAKEEDFDVLCVQETKLQEDDIEEIRNNLPSEFDSFWSCSTAKLGYSGTAVLSRVKPVSVKYGMEVPDHDSEGRLITVEFDTFFLLSTYVPNAGDKLVRLAYRTEEWDPALSQYIKKLEEHKPVVLTGDLNCANEEIDIHNPAGNRKNAGFTDEERRSFKDNFLNQGLVDTFRRQHTDVVGYTYWGYRFNCRSKNIGWRLDYFLVSEALAGNVHDSYIRPDILGSDHCPIGLILKF